MFKGLGAILLAITPKILAKILTALGLGFIVFGGIALAIEELNDFVMAEFDNLPSNVFSLAVIAGFHYGISLMLGAFATSIAIKLLCGAGGHLKDEVKKIGPVGIDC